MRRILVLLMVLTLVFTVGAMAAVYEGPRTAPTSGDDVPDGTGLEDPSSGPLGPNPLAGDGIPDGSTLESPNGPNG